MSDSFYIEPWQVEDSGDALTEREDVADTTFLFFGGVRLGLSLALGAIDVWLSQRGTFEGFVAMWLPQRNSARALTTISNRTD